MNIMGRKAPPWYCFSTSSTSSSIVNDEIEQSNVHCKRTHDNCHKLSRLKCQWTRCLFSLDFAPSLDHQPASLRASLLFWTKHVFSRFITGRVSTFFGGGKLGVDMKLTQSMLKQTLSSTGPCSQIVSGVLKCGIWSRLVKTFSFCLPTL